jgi:hypothetical protein
LYKSKKRREKENWQDIFILAYYLTNCQIHLFCTFIVYVILTCWVYTLIFHYMVCFSLAIPNIGSTALCDISILVYHLTNCQNPNPPFPHVCCVCDTHLLGVYIDLSILGMLFVSNTEHWEYNSLWYLPPNQLPIFFALLLYMSYL